LGLVHRCGTWVIAGLTPLEIPPAVSSVSPDSVPKSFCTEDELRRSAGVVLEDDRRPCRRRDDEWQPAPVHVRRPLHPLCALEGHDAFPANCPRNDYRSDSSQRATGTDLEPVNGPGAAGLDVEELRSDRWRSVDGSRVIEPSSSAVEVTLLTL
jgi:hypothetical protein